MTHLEMALASLKHLISHRVRGFLFLSPTDRMHVDELSSLASK